MSNGTIPGYLPSHLRGQVDGFRNEPDGRISFRHDAAGQGGFGDDGGRKFISPDQYKKTFDPTYRMTHLVNKDKNGEVRAGDVMSGQYGLQKYPTSMAQQLNEMVGGGLRKGLDWGLSSQGKATGTAGLLAALAGGVGGTMLASRAGDEHPLRKGLLMALLAGVTGGGLSAALQSNNTNIQNAMAKRAGVSDETAYLRSVVLGESKMDASEKAEVLRALVKMKDDERDDLANKARSLFGFGAGIYIARVLFSKGLIPQLVGGIIGATALSSSSGKSHKPKMNSWGQLSI